MYLASILMVLGRSSDTGRRTSATVHFNSKIPLNNTTDHVYRSKDVSSLYSYNLFLSSYLYRYTIKL